MCRLLTGGDTGPTEEAEVRATGQLVLPYSLASASVARRHVREMLDRQGVPAGRCDDAALIVSELVGNALRHGRPRPNGTLQVTWRLEDDRLRIEVRDGGGLSKPEVRPLNGDMTVSGRGLAIIDVVAESWGSRRDEAGTTVWALVRAPRVAAAGRRGYGEMESAG